MRHTLTRHTAPAAPSPRLIPEGENRDSFTGWRGTQLKGAREGVRMRSARDKDSVLLLVGPELADRFLRFLDVWSEVLGGAGAHELDRPADRSPAAIRADLARLSRQAEEVLRLLVLPDVSFRIRNAALEGHWGQDEIDALLQRTADNLKALQRLSDEAAIRLRVGRGVRPNVRRLLALQSLAGWFAREGLPLGTGENSKFVRAARLVSDRLGFADDPRDSVRRAVASGVLPLTDIAAAADYMRSAGASKGGAKPPRKRKAAP